MTGNGNVAGETDDSFPKFIQARFPIALHLPDGDTALLVDARKAINKEYRAAAKWKRLRCDKVERIYQADSATVYELQIGHAVEFDWTWEGAVAFRPVLLKEFSSSQAAFSDHTIISPDIDDSILWAGEVLEVDEAAGRIFIETADPEHPPRCGSFYVRPYEFLACLDAAYNDPAFQKLLPQRLAASEGKIHPDVSFFSDVGLNRLKPWWRKSWSLLWGPPGTGKTYLTGQQIARVLADPSERILVCSTTNRATDAVALSIGRAAQRTGIDDLLGEGGLLRIGKGTSAKKFEQEALSDMLQGTEIEFLVQIEQLVSEYAHTKEIQEKALIQQRIRHLRQIMQDAAKRNFLDASVRVVISTAFKAMTFLELDEIKNSVQDGLAPFTTIFIDEAGLMSRLAVSALSLFAACRVVLVGDPKQLAPISKISRILEPAQGNWLAHSGLSHLEHMDRSVDGVHALTEQYRMHPQLCDAVSAFQYNGALTTADKVRERSNTLPLLLKKQPRAIWYVLDEDTDSPPSLRAERGSGNRSWVRHSTRRVLLKIFADPKMRTANGLFIAPFKAQAKLIDSFFKSNNLNSWTASTVHSQQGAEADIVLFDSVNAGSCAWPYDEWKRLINVALSRAREVVIVFASRAEMEEPYLRPLVKLLSPQVLKKKDSKLFWQKIQTKTEFTLPAALMEKASFIFGAQLARRKELRPVLSQEQERLCGLKLDGRPRLVRGVAGSGKTVVLAHWLMKTVQRLSLEENVRIWAIFANRSLQSLISNSIETAWKKESESSPFPWDRVELHHVKDILDVMLQEVGLNAGPFKFDPDGAAQALLERIPISEISPRCDALFIDEAQDMGASTLKLLSAIVRQTDEADKNSRAINIFYDNAQNIYGRSTPKWSEFDLDMRGRSSVMKESFRSTKPITEFAINVLYRLQPPENNPDHNELITRGLIEHSRQSGSDWWKVRFNQVDGPKPEFREYENLKAEFEALGEYCRYLIAEQGVQPSDICLLYNGRNIPALLKQHTVPQLAGLGVEFSVRKGRSFQRTNNTLLATTSHSYKGYDSEIIIVAGVDGFKARGKGVLANVLYVAMTRARSILTLFSQRMDNEDAQKICSVIRDCLAYPEERPEVETDRSSRDDMLELIERIGHNQRKWLLALRKKYKFSLEPIISKNGEVIAEPLFQIKAKGIMYACFGAEPPEQAVCQRLKKFGIELLEPGQDIHD